MSGNRQGTWGNQIKCSYLEAPLIKCPCAISYSFASFKCWPHRRVELEALQKEQINNNKNNKRIRWWPVFSLTSRSPMSYVVPLIRGETSAAHVSASFSQPWYKKVRYVCIYLVLSATDQAKSVRELTQHVGETNSVVSKQDVGETTVNYQGLFSKDDDDYYCFSTQLTWNSLKG